MKDCMIYAFKFIFFLVPISILIMLLTTISFFELSRVNAQDNLAQIDKLTNQGITLTKSGNYTGAIEQCDKALTIDPDNTIAMNDKGLALDESGNPEEALMWYDKALAVDGNYTIAINNKGNALKDLGKPEEALMWFDKVLALDGNNTVAMNGKGQALERLGEPEEAIVWFDKVLAIDRNDSVAMYNKADALSSLGNYSEAAELNFKTQSLSTTDQVDASVRDQNETQNNNQKFLTDENNRREIERIESTSQSSFNITSATTYFKDDYYHIVGEVLNSAPEEKEFVKATATIYDEDNNVIGTDTTFTSPSTIPSQESAPFEFLIGQSDVSDLDKIKSYKIVASID